MQKTDFEKNVQEKMKELRFRPSEEVWKQVKASISSKKRSRPIIFWLLFAGLVLVGGLYYIISTPLSRKPLIIKSAQQPGQAMSNPRSASHVRFKQGTKQNDSVVEEVAIKDDNFSTEHDIRNAHLFPVDKSFYSMGQINPEKMFNEIGLEKNKLFIQTVQNLIQRRKSKWQPGLIASIGISHLANDLLQGGNYTGSNNNYYNPPGIKQSDVKSGPVILFGVQASKSLNDKLNLSVGLSYQYFSNSIKVGERKDSLIFLINQSNQTMDKINQYYVPGNNNQYKNKYHFISLPLMLQWQFAPRVAWENGLVYSYLIHTNALHYEERTGIYYQNSNLFNKHQLFASTALLFGCNRNTIQIGPQLQYAFTNLDKNSGSTKHLSTASIKMTMRFPKK